MAFRSSYTSKYLPKQAHPAQVLLFQEGGNSSKSSNPLRSTVKMNGLEIPLVLADRYSLQKAIFDNRKSIQLVLVSGINGEFFEEDESFFKNSIESYFTPMEQPIIIKMASSSIVDIQEVLRTNLSLIFDMDN